MKKRQSVMRDNLTIPKRTVGAGIIISALFVLAGGIFEIPLLQVVFFIFWVAAAAHIAASHYCTISQVEKFFYGFFTIFVSLGLVVTVTYFALPKFSSEIVLTVFALASAALVILARDQSVPIPKQPKANWTWLLAGAALLGDLFILGSYSLVRTDAALASPWVFFGLPFFVLYGFTTFFLLWYAHESSSKFSIVLSVVHLFTSFSAATILYQIGFGFDPFIHRAAESALAQDGFIEPKQILYAGQYALVVAAHYLSGLSISLIDKWLVPIAAAFFIPLASYIGLTKGLGLTDRAARVWLHLILVVPYMSVVFTVPYNLTVVFFLVTIFLLPAVWNDRCGRWLIVTSSVLSILVHPLLSAPMILFVAFVLSEPLLEKIKSKVQVAFPILFFFGLVLALPILFSVYNVQQGADPFVLENPLQRTEFFVGLFTDPYRHSYFEIPFEWEMIYTYRTYVPPVLLFASIILSFSVLRREKYIFRLGLYNLGVLVSLFFVSTLFIFQDIIFYEQSEFALRILHASYLASIPAIVVYFNKLRRTRELSFAILLSGLLLISIASTFAYYFSYPQSNPKSVVSGPSVSGADVDAVRYIEELADGEHFVLSNQMTSAAALQELGFARYLDTDAGDVLWYAIPTGGELYTYYWAMTYEYPRREVMQAAAEFTNTKTGYYLVHYYWPYAGWLSEVARQSADNYYEIRSGEVIIFEYKF